jgi:hypothetical protein
MKARLLNEPFNPVEHNDQAERMTVAKGFTIRLK